jgi:hypothetical protein
MLHVACCKVQGICQVNFFHTLLVATRFVLHYMNNYRDLEIYKLAFELAFRVHKESLKLPKFELYEQGSQIRLSPLLPCVVRPASFDHRSLVAYAEELRHPRGEGGLRPESPSSVRRASCVLRPLTTVALAKVVCALAPLRRYAFAPFFS